MKSFLLLGYDNDQYDNMIIKIISAGVIFIVMIDLIKAKKVHYKVNMQKYLR